MSDADDLTFECKLDAAPEKVWRALTVPAYLEHWLKPAAERLDMTVIEAEENRSVTYRWREGRQGAVTGFEDSVVTFEITPMADGGTWFRLTHAPQAVPVAANSNVAMAMAA